MSKYAPEIIQRAAEAIQARERTYGEDPWRADAEAALDAIAQQLGEQAAQAVIAHMEAHGPRKPRGALEPVLDTGRTYRTWRRHMGIAARIAAGAFMTDKDRLQMAADALRRGDFAVCPPPEGSSAVADRERCVYCGKKDYEPGWGCHTCGTATIEDVRNG